MRALVIEENEKTSRRRSLTDLPQHELVSKIEELQATVASSERHARTVLEKLSVLNGVIDRQDQDMAEMHDAAREKNLALLYDLVRMSMALVEKLPNDGLIVASFMAKQIEVVALHIHAQKDDIDLPISALFRRLCKIACYIPRPGTSGAMIYGLADNIDDAVLETFPDWFTEVAPGVFAHRLEGDSEEVSHGRE